MEKYSGIASEKLAAKRRKNPTLPGGIPSFRPHRYDEQYFMPGKRVLAGPHLGDLKPTEYKKEMSKPREAEGEEGVDGRNLLYPLE